MSVLIVPGHSVWGMGAAYSGGAGRCEEKICVIRARYVRIAAPDRHGGHATCECGEQSPHLFSQRERQAWHRQHKAEIEAADRRPEGQRMPVASRRDREDERLL